MSDNYTRKILVIAPHADDEVLGCGGAIARAIEEHADVTLIIMATGGVKHHHLAKRATTSQRIEELEASNKILGIGKYQILFPDFDMRLEKIPMLDIVTKLDNIISDTNFDEYYIPESSHNLDHQITHRAAIAALRPATRMQPALVAAYEGTSQDLCSKENSVGMLYIDITHTFAKKITALNSYISQIKPYPHPTSIEAVRRLALMRGLESGLDHAERFRILRLIKK